MGRYAHPKANLDNRRIVVAKDRFEVQLLAIVGNNVVMIVGTYRFDLKGFEAGSSQHKALDRVLVSSLDASQLRYIGKDGLLGLSHTHSYSSLCSFSIKKRALSFKETASSFIYITFICRGSSHIDFAERAMRFITF